MKFLKRNWAKMFAISFFLMALILAAIILNASINLRNALSNSVANNPYTHPNMPSWQNGITGTTSGILQYSAVVVSLLSIIAYFVLKMFKLKNDKLAPSVVFLGSTVTLLLIIVASIMGGGPMSVIQDNIAYYQERYESLRNLPYAYANLSAEYAELRASYNGLLASYNALVASGTAPEAQLAGMRQGLAGMRGGLAGMTQGLESMRVGLYYRDANLYNLQSAIARETLERWSRPGQAIIFMSMFGILPQFVAVKQIFFAAKPITVNPSEDIVYLGEDTTVQCTTHNAQCTMNDRDVALASEQINVEQEQAADTVGAGIDCPQGMGAGEQDADTDTTDNTSPLSDIPSPLDTPTTNTNDKGEQQ